MRCRSKTKSGKACKKFSLNGQEKCRAHTWRRMLKPTGIRKVDVDVQNEVEMYERFAEIMYLADIIREEAANRAYTDRSLALALYKRGVRPPEESYV